MRSSILLVLLLASTAYALDKKRFCKCRIQGSKRIINGRDVEQLSFPWQVSLQLKEIVPVPDVMKRLMPDNYKVSYHFCGGSIINEHWILTASHCVDAVAARLMQVGYGELDLVNMYERSKYVEVEETFKHPEYTMYGGILNDAALIKLKKPLSFSRTVQPACLGTKHVDLYDGVLKMSGWGTTEEAVLDSRDGKPLKDAKIPRRLQEADVTDQSNTLKETCKNTMQNICVTNATTHETACKGDSGGPLHHTVNGRSSVIGMASFVNLKENYPKVTVCLGETAYTRLSTFFNWVKSKIGDDYCEL